MKIPQYKDNQTDKPIIEDITNTLIQSLDEWYGKEARLESEVPEIRSYRNSFILRYRVVMPGTLYKNILVKIRRNPKMDSLSLAIGANIHQNIPTEYQSISSVYKSLEHMKQDFSAIRPLTYIPEYFAIVMEEYPSRTLRQLLVNQRSSNDSKGMNELMDAARKTGRWLHYFHHHIHIPTERDYSVRDILKEVQSYGERLESYSRGRIRSQDLVDEFSRKIENLSIKSILFSQSHADMTCDNVLYSEDNKVCIIDIKTRPAPIYADLGLILIHPETSKPMIFSMGAYYPESLLREYRSQITAGYFDEEPGDEILVRIYSAIKVMDKWLMYEELMSRYRGVKHLLSVPVGPFVTLYFQNLLKKHLELINNDMQYQASGTLLTKSS